MWFSNRVTYSSGFQTQRQLLFMEDGSGYDGMELKTKTPPAL